MSKGKGEIAPTDHRAVPFMKVEVLWQSKTAKTATRHADAPFGGIARTADHPTTCETISPPCEW
jgi:hypothetical protein